MNEATRPYVFEKLLRRLERSTFEGDFWCSEAQI
jgi:hypothetical protein